MLRALPLIAVGLMLSGCNDKPIEQMNYEERRALASEIVGRCIALGLKPETREMQTCMEVELDAEIANRAANRNKRIAVGQAMARAGQGMQSHRPVNCTSTGFGNTVSTSCF